MTFEEAASKMHDSKEAMFRAAYFAAKEVYLRKISKKELGPSFLPETTVAHHEIRALTVFFDLGFLSEADVTRISQLSAKTLKIGKPTKLAIEDGSSLSGYPVNLRGVPSQEVPALRKLRVELRVQNVLEETLMKPDDQLRREQARELWDLACERQEDAAPTGVKPGSRGNMNSIEGILAKSAEILQDLPFCSSLHRS